MRVRVIEKALYEEITDRLKDQWEEDLDPFWLEVLAFMRWQNRVIDDLISREAAHQIESLKLKAKVNEFEQSMQEMSEDRKDDQ